MSRYSEVDKAQHALILLGVARKAWDTYAFYSKGKRRARSVVQLADTGRAALEAQGFHITGIVCPIALSTAREDESPALELEGVTMVYYSPLYTVVPRSIDMPTKDLDPSMQAESIVIAVLEYSQALREGVLAALIKERGKDGL